MKSYVTLVICCLVLVVGIIFLVRKVNEAESAWAKQPPAAKAAALQLEKQLESDLRPGDLVINDNEGHYKLMYVEHHFRGASNAGLRACTNCQVGSFLVSLLARDQVKMIHPEDAEYKDAAAAFLQQR
jgi:hypothetical protein